MSRFAGRKSLLVFACGFQLSGTLMIEETFKRQMKSRLLFFAFSIRDSINIRPTEDNYGLNIFVCVLLLQRIWSKLV